MQIFVPVILVAVSSSWSTVAAIPGRYDDTFSAQEITNDAIDLEPKDLDKAQKQSLRKKIADFMRRYSERKEALKAVNYRKYPYVKNDFDNSLPGRYQELNTRNDNYYVN